jgi:hypothetical protein
MNAICKIEKNGQIIKMDMRGRPKDWPVSGSGEKHCHADSIETVKSTRSGFISKLPNTL